MSNCHRIRTALLSIGLAYFIAASTHSQTMDVAASSEAGSATLVSSSVTSPKTPVANVSEVDNATDADKVFTRKSDAARNKKKAATREPDLRTIEAILALTPEEVAEQELVRIEGTVHSNNPVQNSVFLHDGAHDIYVRYHDTRRLTTGQRVSILGRTANGIANNIVVASQVDVLQDKVPLADPVTIEVESANQEHLDCKWVRVNDLLIESVVAEGEVLTLVGKQENAFLYVSVFGTIPQAELAQLVGSKVSVLGNFGLFVVGDQVQGVAVFTHPKLITQTQVAENTLQLMPFMEVGALWIHGGEQFRTQGSITFRDEYGVFLQDETAGTWFEFEHPLPFLEPGAVVGGVGFREKTEGGGVRLALRLVNVRYRDSLPDVEVTPVELLPPTAESTRVRLTGRLQDFQYNSDRQLSELILQCGSKRVLVHVPSDNAKHNTMHLQTASEVSVAGTITFSPQSQQDANFDLRMFSPSFDDIDVGVRKGVWRSQVVQNGLLLSGLVVMACLAWGYRHRLSDVKKRRELVGLSAQVRSSYDSIRDGILILDDQLRFIEANRKAREFFDFDFEMGRNCDSFETQLASKLDAKGFLEFWTEQNSKPDDTAESVFEIKGEHRRILEVFTSPVDTAGGEPAARLWAFYDVTERWRLQDSLVHAQKQEAIGRLAGGIAHDFNNFLTGISGNLFVAKLDDTKTVAEVSESLDAAQGAARRAAALVAKLLGFSQKTPLHRREICVNDVVKNMETLLRPSLPIAIKLHFDLQQDLPQVSADPVQLEQVLINICINARDSLDQKCGVQPKRIGETRTAKGTDKSGPNGEQVPSLARNGSSSNGNGNVVSDYSIEGLIAVRTRTANVDGVRHVQIAIRDNGCGIPKDQMSQIFEPFFTTKGSNGTGLGLAMSQGILQLHGGTITVDSTLGQGTEFVVSLPAAKVTPASSTATASAKTLPGLQGRHVLIVDDEASIRSLMSRVFSAEEMIVHAVTNGDEAIELMSGRSHDIELVVLDWKMPVRSGKETLPWLKKEFPNVPVIVCSGYVYEAETEFEQSQYSPDFYLQKPFRVHDIVQKARSALSRGPANR